MKKRRGKKSFHHRDFPPKDSTRKRDRRNEEIFEVEYVTPLTPQEFQSIIGEKIREVEDKIDKLISQAESCLEPEVIDSFDSSSDLDF